MLGEEHQEFVVDGRWEGDAAACDGVLPAEQVAVLQGVEDVAEFLDFGLAIVGCGASGKAVKFLIVVVHNLVAASLGEQLLAGAIVVYYS